MKRLAQNLFLATGTVVVCLLLLEAGVRFIGAYDLDGNFIICGRTLKPYHLPIRTTRQKTAEYLHSERTRVMADAQLGWTNRPGGQSADRLYAYNALGARISPAAPVEYSSQPPPDTLRIVIVGDSYTHGDEVPFEHTWGYYLEKNLQQAGIHAEVINLAVGAYGMDQAFLRWQQVGRSLAPHIVILGLQMENCQRNVNLVKPLYQPNTGLPFAKPRFIFADAGLALIHSPTTPPEHIPELLENIAKWPLAAHEHFLASGYYQEKVWLKSRLVGLGLEMVSPMEGDPYFYDVDEEPARLSLAIIKMFQSQVAAAGSSLYVVHIPIVLDLLNLRLGRDLVYAELLATVEAEQPVIRSQSALLEQARENSFFALFRPGGHYSTLGNKAIAGVVSRQLLMSVHNKTAPSHDTAKTLRPEQGIIFSLNPPVSAQ